MQAWNKEEVKPIDAPASSNMYSCRNVWFALSPAPVAPPVVGVSFNFKDEITMYTIDQMATAAVRMYNAIGGKQHI